MSIITILQMILSLITTNDWHVSCFFLLQNKQMKSTALLISIFLSLVLSIVQARLSDEHALHLDRSKFTQSISNVFFGERRHVGFGKFVGSGDSLSTAKKLEKPPTIMRKLILATIFHLSLKNSNFLNSWKGVLQGFLNKRKQLPMKHKILSPSGPTNGWYYGSQH